MSSEALNEAEVRDSDPLTIQQDAGPSANTVMPPDVTTGHGPAWTSDQPIVPVAPPRPRSSTTFVHDRHLNHTTESNDAWSFTYNALATSGLDEYTDPDAVQDAITNALAQSFPDQAASSAPNMIQQHQDLSQYYADWQRAENHTRGLRAAAERDVRTMQQALSSVGLDHARTDPRQAPTIDSDSERAGESNQHLTTQQQARTIQIMGDALRREQSRHRYRVLANARDIAAETHDTDTPTGSNSTARTQEASNETTNPGDESLSARRDLERAFRDYRLARRNLRTNYTPENNSSVDPNNPTYQGVLAQLAEQQSNNRNRMRARGQSRSNTLDRTDTSTVRIPVSVGAGNDTWQSDEENDSNDPAELRSARLPRHADRNVLRPSASNVPFNLTNNPYLGPTSNAGSSSTSTGGMRDFYRRVEEQESARARSVRRLGLAVGRARQSEPQSSATSAALSPTTAQRDVGSNREQRVQDMLSRFSIGQSLALDKVELTARDLIKIRAQNVLKYLSGIKTMHDNGDRALVMAKSLEIDSLAESLTREMDFDLPLRISELPYVQFSSWLSSGMSWKGFQKSSSTKFDWSTGSSIGQWSSGPLFEHGSIENRIFHLRAWRHRERVRAEQRSLAARNPDSSSQNPAMTTEEDRRILTRLGSSGGDTLADVERHLSDLLEEEERRLNRSRDSDWRVNPVSSRPRPSASTSTSTANQDALKEQWPVQITLHEVNWQKMTVSGTMIASQIANRASTASTSRSQISTGTNEDTKDDEEELSPDLHTFFYGEIIDFRTHELETIANKPGYKVGGPITDLSYWSQVGPFKVEVAKRIQDAQDAHAKDAYAQLGISGTLDEQRMEYQRTFTNHQDSIEKLDKAKIDEVAWGVMVECLGSRKWLEKAYGDGGWVLMRWKERCFVTPPSSRPASSSSAGSDYEHVRFRTLRQAPGSTRAYTTTYSDDRHHDRGGTRSLTIQGFYYVALHRLSGQIEALYYDNDSSPFQEMYCQPTDAIPSGDKIEGDDDIFGGIKDIGIRKNFGVYEFR